MHKGFPAVVDEKTRVLVLGSFPGVESLRVQQYYGHPRNQFWKLLGDVLNVDLVSMQYEQRLQTILKYNIGLWDVLDACTRDGSLDSAIRDEQCNDFASLREVAPQLKVICFNGKKSASYEKELKALGYVTAVLPSSSPANQTVTYVEKLKKWREAIT